MEVNVVRQESMMEVHRVMTEIGASGIHYFKCKRVAYVVDADDGRIYSVKLYGRELKVIDGILYLVSSNGDVEWVVNTNTMEGNFNILRECTTIRNKTGNTYKYITFSILPYSPIKVYVHHIVALCKYGLQVLRVMSQGSEDVVDHRNQVDKQNNSTSNLEIVSRGENVRRYVRYLKSIRDKEQLTEDELNELVYMSGGTLNKEEMVLC